jgi:hypothetical protein
MLSGFPLSTILGLFGDKIRIAATKGEVYL